MRPVYLFSAVPAYFGNLSFLCFSKSTGAEGVGGCSVFYLQSSASLPLACPSLLGKLTPMGQMPWSLL